MSVDTTVYPDGGGGPAEVGVKCLIHQNSGSNGQDVLNGGLPGALTYPLEIQAGPDHPLSASLAGGYVNTSDSLVTVPVYDDIAAAGAPPIAGAQIVGFLQLFIDDSFPGNGSWKAGTFHVTVVNVAGCGTDALAGKPVFPGSTSAVPVRLIHQ